MQIFTGVHTYFIKDQISKCCHYNADDYKTSVNPQGYICIKMIKIYIFNFGLNKVAKEIYERCKISYIYHRKMSKILTVLLEIKFCGSAVSLD